MADKAFLFFLSQVQSSQLSTTAENALSPSASSCWMRTVSAFYQSLRAGRGSFLISDANDKEKITRTIQGVSARATDVPTPALYCPVGSSDEEGEGEELEKS